MAVMLTKIKVEVNRPYPTKSMVPHKDVNGTNLGFVSNNLRTRELIIGTLKGN